MPRPGAPVSAERWNTMMSLFNDALERPPDERLAFLAEACGSDAELRAEVESLLAVHDSDADFAAWCHYKYCNSGPGAVAGAFVHERHARSERPRFAGWWGHDQATRFRMGPEFRPTPGADGWQLSNPPILALAPLRVSLDLFQRAGMAALRNKSEQLTGWLETLIEAHLADTLQIVTPRDRAQRGCQLSLRVAGGRERGRALFEHLESIGIIGDWREPDVIRISPVPLYNRHTDVLDFVRAVAAWRDGAAA